MSEYNVVVEFTSTIDEAMAKDAMRALMNAYPGHPWHVNVTGGILSVKHMRLSPKWAMVRKYTRMQDAKVLQMEMLRVGGEFLERAGLVRGQDRGGRVTVVDGIPSKDLVIA